MSQQEQKLSDTDYRPCDARYRSSRYFLDDQLKCSEALADFNAVKSALAKIPAFGKKLALVPVPVQVRRK